MTAMIPASAPGLPPGAGDDTLQAPIVAAWVIMTTAAVVTVCLRFYTRCFVLRVTGPEDWLILVAVVCPFWASSRRKKGGLMVGLQPLLSLMSLSLVDLQCRRMRWLRSPSV